METSNCSSCGKALSANEVLFTTEGNPICQLCNDKADVAKAMHVPRAAMDVPGAVDNLVTAREYEFTGAENAVIRSLAGPLRFVGGMSILFGVIYLVAGVRTMVMMTARLGIFPLIEGSLFVLVGSWLLPAASALSAVVDTEGSDITNLMFALKKLRNVFMLQAILWALACGLVVIGILVSGAL